MKALIAFSLLALAPLHAAEKKQEAEAKVIVGGQVRAPGPVKFEKKLRSSAMARPRPTT